MHWNVLSIEHPSFVNVINAFNHHFIKNYIPAKQKGIDKKGKK